MSAWIQIAMNLFAHSLELEGLVLVSRQYEGVVTSPPLCSQPNDRGKAGDRVGGGK
jgi:hypothetical protein